MILDLLVHGREAARPESRQQPVEWDHLLECVEHRRPTLQQERRHQHRDHRDAEELLVQKVGQESRDATLFRQDKRELADLRYRDTGE